MIKVGDKVKVVKAIRSESSKALLGRIGTVTNVSKNSLTSGVPLNSISLDIEKEANGSGLWLDEVELVQDEQKTDTVRKGNKFDSGKPMMRFLTREFLEQTALAQSYGAKKYGHWNFQKGLETTALYDAAIRHMLAWMSGEDTDPESGNPHLGHAAANLNMLIWTLANMPQMDDRPKGEEK